MNTADRFAIVPLYKDQPPPANAIVHGGIDAVMERIVDSNTRNDAIDLIHEAAVALGQLEARRDQETQVLARSIQTMNDAMDVFARRLDALEEERSEKLRHDAALEQKQIQDYLDSLPDPDEPATYEPGGEIHTQMN